MSIFDKIKVPPREFSPSAFWFWYGDLDPDELRRQIDLMVEQGVYNGFMHPRAYLKTPYLEDKWWDAVAACVDEGNKTGFYPWLYDEYAWPSGTAGSTFPYGYQKPSRTLASGIKNMAKSLVMRRFASAADFKEGASLDENQSLLCLFYGDGTVCHINDVDYAKGELFVFYVKVHPTLVDYMNKETVREFLNYTHEEYKKRYGKFFGNRIPGIFFDEIYMNHFSPWTDELPREFEARRGYDLMPRLFALALEGGDEEREVRRDYYKTVSELYEEAFFEQIGSWCHENNLKLTGHTEEDIGMHPSRQGNYFNTIRRLQIPGVDCHDYRYRFPRKITYREPKLAVSVSRAYGKERAMSEAFGGAGWACTLQEFKRGVNTAGAMGISMFTLHGFYSDIDSQGSQSDWPGNFFYQNPYWRYFKYFADYISRVCYVNSRGVPVVDVALYYPIEDLQRETYIKGLTCKGRAIDASLNVALNCLIENQIDVDMIDGESLLRSEISNGRLCVGKESFSVLLIHEAATIDGEVSEKLARFRKDGGKIIYYSTRKDGNGEFVAPENIHKAVADAISLDACVLKGDREDLFINHRKIDGKDFYFVANSSSVSRELTLLLREKGYAEKISPENGDCSAVSYSLTEQGTVVELSLDEDEGLWIVIDPQNAPAEYKQERITEETELLGEWDFLPVAADLGGEEQIACERSELNVPLATFSSDLHSKDNLIRIQNKAGEKGYVGRHLSLWNAAWITRRIGWKDSSASKDLYFRRRFDIDRKPDRAEICIAAVNEWQLYINGGSVSSSKAGSTPITLDITSYLREGENLICVSVHNPTPMEKATLLQREELIAELMISLIAEIELTFGEEKRVICTDSEWITCEAVTNDWLSLKYDPKASYVDPITRLNQAPALNPAEWSFAWERGRPPLKPFGDIPRFGETVQYPQKVRYGIDLPSGSAAVKYPDVSGDIVALMIDGMPASFCDGVCRLTPDGKEHCFEIALIANGADDGLHSPLSVELVPQKYTLDDWRLHGLEWHSGFASYKKSFTLSSNSGRYILDLGKVCHQAEVLVNGKLAGERIWAPYRFDITELLHKGDNEITVIVSNSAGVEHQFMLLDEGEALGWNRYWNYDNIRRDSEKLISGMIGPVKIIKYQ